MVPKPSLTLLPCPTLHAWKRYSRLAESIHSCPNRHRDVHPQEEGKRQSGLFHSHTGLSIEEVRS